MKPWKVIALMTVPMLLFGTWYIWSTYKERNAPVAVKQGAPERKITQDDLVNPRKMYIDSLKSARALDGKTVWMQAGYQVEYYPYSGHTIGFAHKSGLLPSVQQLEVIDVVEEATPKGWLSRIQRGARNIFVIFRMPGDEKEYAVPVGYVEDGNERFFTDDLFYYDDPHGLYKHWPPEVWQAIDQHQVKPGMSEMQTMMALGQVQQSGSAEYGNRTVNYTAGDRRVSVTFVNDKATEVKEDKTPG